MPLDFGATFLSTYLAQMLIHGSKESISRIWNYSNDLTKLQETLIMKLHELEKTLIRINNMNPIQTGSLFSSKWVGEIEEFWYKMCDLKDEPNKQNLTGSLKFFIDKIADMQKELERKEATMNRELTQTQDESSSSKSAKQQELPTRQTRHNLWVEDKNAIIQKLIEGESLGVTIVGICGSGKTQLARAVAKDESIKVHFPCIIDILPEFSCARVTKHIYEKLPASETIRSTRVLILLDGLQEVDFSDLGSFHMFCKDELHSESKVLVTTQNPQIARVTGTNKYLLDNLSNDECFRMILNIAGTSGNLSELDEKAITFVEYELVKKCMGLPLLANCIGALLSAAEPGQRETTIREIILQDLWKWEEFSSVLGKMTLVSLLQERPFLKWCLNDCSLFPPGTKFDKDLLLQLWMAEGLIPFSKEEEHFEYLLSHSIFQSSDNKPPYEMHPLAYDFAQNVSSRAFHREDIGESRHSASTGITDITRHFSLSCKDSTGDDKKAAANAALAVIKRNCKDLRTFLLVQPAGELISENPTFFQSLTLLRVLDLSHTALIELSPKTFSKLRCLRYLDLSYTPITEVPSLSKNLALQVLKLNGCKNLRTLPHELVRLTNLLYFQVDIVTKFVEMPPGMGQLKNLRGLDVFRVGHANSGRGIEQLKEMNDLRKSLTIGRLERVKSGSEAREAELQNKRKLKTLNLEWSAHSTHAEAKEVLEGLKPHQDLTELRIINYSGSAFPEWLSRRDVCLGLNTIKLDDCKACSKLPPLGGLPLLKHIHLKGMDALERLPALPLSLKSLTIDECSDVLKKRCLDVGADWRKIKDLVVTIDSIPHQSSSTQIVHFRPLERPKEDDFSLELSKINTYDEVVEKVGQQLHVDDPSKIRLTSHNCYSQQPEQQPIKFRGVDRLSDMLVHYNQTSDILYYEVLGPSTSKPASKYRSISPGFMPAERMSKSNTGRSTYVAAKPESSQQATYVPATRSRSESPGVKRFLGARV